MAYQTVRQEYLQVPPVTRAYTTACVLTTAAVVSPHPRGPPSEPAGHGGCAGVGVRLTGEQGLPQAPPPWARFFRAL